MNDAEKSLLARLAEVLRRRQKALAGLFTVPVAALFVHLGIGKLLGADLSGELEAMIVALLVGAIVERVPNKQPTPNRKARTIDDGPR